MFRWKASVFDIMDLRSAIADSVADTMKSLGKESTKELLAQNVSEVLKETGSDVVSGVIGSVAGNLLKQVLKVQDQVRSRLDSLIAVPIDTGVRAARQALNLEANSDAERSFRDDQLRFAIDELERALSLTSRLKPNDVTEYYVLMLQGLCAGEISSGGGMPFAREKLRPVAERLDAASIEQNEKVKFHEAEESVYTTFANKPYDNKKANEWKEILRSYDDHYQKRIEHCKKIAASAREASAKARALKRDFDTLAKLIRAV